MPIKLLEDLPETVLGFEGIGKITDDDYKTVDIPAQARLKRHAKARLLYVPGPSFEGYEAGAMLDDTKLGLAYFGSWEKIAFVTDDRTYRTLVRAVGFDRAARCARGSRTDQASRRAASGAGTAMTTPPTSRHP